MVLPDDTAGLATESAGSPGGIPRHAVLNSHVDAFTTASFLHTIERSVRLGDPLLVANHNVMSLSLHQLDHAFRRFYELADHVFIDGAPVVTLANLRGARLDMSNRLAVLDWIWPLFALAEARGWHIVHLGGTEPMLTRVSEAVRARHPELQLTLVDGFFDIHDTEDNAAVLAAITRAEPSVLLVGMGMPRQEHWLLDVRSALPSCTVITVGGVLSFIGGERPTPPRWLGRFHLEWVYRLVTEPRRLWRRYLVDTRHLIPVVARDVVHAVRSRSHRGS